MNLAPGRPLVNVLEIIVHHSKTPDGEAIDAAAIRRYHVQHNGWDDVGYHYLVERNADGAVLVLVGRPEDRQGAHCRSYNRNSIGVCFVGDYDQVPPDDELLQVAATRVFVPLLARHGLTPRSIIGDRDHHPGKTCPGDAFDLERLRAFCAQARKARR